MQEVPLFTEGFHPSDQKAGGIVECDGDQKQADEFNVPPAIKKQGCRGQPRTCERRAFVAKREKADKCDRQEYEKKGQGIEKHF
ncbi:MAG: hypothetical protein WA138_01240 [Parvibaculum sp.]